MNKLWRLLCCCVIGWFVAACALPLEPLAEIQSRAQADVRLEIEERLLDATVRVQIETWLVNENEQGYTILQAEGHGTVVNGRYLITHNHHNIPLLLSETGFDPNVYSRLIIYNAAGEEIGILPMTDFRIALREEQMLLLAYTGDKLSVPFGTMGLDASQIAAWQNAAIQPEDTVAQINWDGAATTVTWAQVTAVRTARTPPCLELASQTLVGASGGAVFWNGLHIGNNWLNGTVSSPHDAQTRHYSLAAMNSAELAAFFMELPP